MAGAWVTRWRVRAGYPAAILYIVLSSPTPDVIAAGAALAVIGLVIRGAAAGHLRKLETLTTSGPYAWTRNPLYLGSAFLVAGFAVASGSLWSALLIVGYFLVFYPAVMKKEKAELRLRYGAAFDEYAARVPLFFPRPPRRNARASHGLSDSAEPVGAPAAPGPAPQDEKFSWQQYRRNREYQAAIGTVGALALLWLRMIVRHRTGW